MPPTPPRILLIEDEELVYKTFADLYAPVATIVTVTTLAEAEGIVETLANSFNIAVVDACLGGNIPNTLRLPSSLTKWGFKGTIVGFSSDPRYLPALRGAGCDQACHKTEIFRLVDRLLELKPSSRPPPANNL
ncbi:hypothetical protein IT413_01565 [Candidatus Peregrinibacteria bacterium]|nr:hypothetical protein [Candidatus Peregrinibacteria bacterium]